MSLLHLVLKLPSGVGSGEDIVRETDRYKNILFVRPTSGTSEKCYLFIAIKPPFVIVLFQGHGDLKLSSVYFAS